MDKTTEPLSGLDCWLVCDGIKSLEQKCTQLAKKVVREVDPAPPTAQATRDQPLTQLFWRAGYRIIGQVKFRCFAILCFSLQARIVQRCSVKHSECASLEILKREVAGGGGGDASLRNRYKARHTFTHQRTLADSDARLREFYLQSSEIKGLRLRELVPAVRGDQAAGSHNLYSSVLILSSEGLEARREIHAT